MPVCELSFRELERLGYDDTRTNASYLRLGSTIESKFERHAELVEVRFERYDSRFYSVHVKTSGKNPSLEGWKIMKGGSFADLQKFLSTYEQRNPDQSLPEGLRVVRADNGYMLYGQDAPKGFRGRGVDVKTRELYAISDQRVAVANLAKKGVWRVGVNRAVEVYVN